MAPDTSEGYKPEGPATEEACEDILVVTVAKSNRVDNSSRRASEDCCC